MSFFTEVPEMSRGQLRDFKKGIDDSFREFSAVYGEGIENFFEPLLWFMVWFEKILLAAPWPIIVVVVGALSWIGSRNWKLSLGSVICFMVIGYLGMWEDTMATLAIISVATLLCISLGIPLGIATSVFASLPCTHPTVRDAPITPTEPGSHTTFTRAPAARSPVATCVLLVL